MFFHSIPGNDLLLLLSYFFSIMVTLLTWVRLPALYRCWTLCIRKHSDSYQDVNPSLTIASFAPRRYLQHSLILYRAQKMGIFLLRPSNLEYTTTGRQAVQLNLTEGDFKLILKTMEKRDRSLTLHFYLIVQYCSDELV